MSVAVRVLTLPFLPEAERFDTSALESLARTGEILSVRSAFFRCGGRPYWSIALVHRLRQAPEEKSVQATAAVGRDRLGEDDAALYQALRSWRAETADAAGVPVFMILTNRQLADVARGRPKSLAALSSIPGVGPGRLRKHGKAILGIVERFEGLQPDPKLSGAIGAPATEVADAETTPAGG